MSLVVCLDRFHSYFTRDDLLALGRSLGVKQDGGPVIDEVLEAVAHWPRFAKEATVPAERVREVGAAHASLVNILKRC